LARTQEASSDVKRGLSKQSVRCNKRIDKRKANFTQKQFTSTTLAQFTLAMPTAKQFETKQIVRKADTCHHSHPPHAEYPLRLGNCAELVVLADKETLELVFELDDEVDDTESVVEAEDGAGVTDEHNPTKCTRTRNKSIGSYGVRAG
jgi:hypothetical protein